MDPLLGLFMTAVGSLWILVHFGLGQRAAHARERLWREAASASGVARLDGSEHLLEGWSGALRVQLSPFAHGRVRGTRITVDGGLPAELAVIPEGFDTRMQGMRGVRETETGDQAFDDAAWVLGPPALAFAVLDVEARRALTSLLQGRLARPRLADLWAKGRLEHGRLVVEVPEVATPGTDSTFVTESQGTLGTPDEAVIGGGALFPVALQLVLDLAHRMARPQDVAAQLAEHLRSEPEVRVRLRGLQALLREFPRHPATTEAARAACDDPIAEIRLEGALALGPEKREVLLALAHGEGAEDGVSARAVAALRESLTLQQAESILRDALRTRRLQTARACLAALGGRGGAEAIGMLGRVLAVEQAELATAAADVLGETRDATAERPVLAALDHEDADVRLAAVRALGRVGTAAAVARLKQAEAEDRALRTAARQAIAEIHSRLAGAEPGQLSLAEGESGQLSIADEREGRLSLPGDAGERRDAPAGRTE